MIRFLALLVVVFIVWKGVPWLIRRSVQSKDFPIRAVDDNQE
jgi:hypothetical protein